MKERCCLSLVISASPDNLSSADGLCIPAEHFRSFRLIFETYKMRFREDKVLFLLPENTAIRLSFAMMQHISVLSNICATISIGSHVRFPELAVQYH